MDQHFTAIEIAGKQYPLNYSIRASRKITELPKLGDDAILQDAYEHNIHYLFVLLEEGADYKKRFLGEDGGFELSEEDLMAYFSPTDPEEIVKAVQDAMTAGTQLSLIHVCPGRIGRIPSNGASALPCPLWMTWRYLLIC